jgi:hypothetical protein
MILGMYLSPFSFGFGPLVYQKQTSATKSYLKAKFYQAAHIKNKQAIKKECRNH